MNIFDTIRDNKTALTPVTEDDYYYALGVLPPIYAKGCFAVSEAYSHRSNGEPVYYWFAERGKDYFACLGTKSEAVTAFQEAK